MQNDDENLFKLLRFSKILQSMRVSKAAGLDKMPARLMRDAEVELTSSLTYLIKKSITDGSVPAPWKVARVTPLYTSEDGLLVENYRLRVLSKVLERVLHTKYALLLVTPARI